MNTFVLNLIRPPSINERDNLIGFTINLLRLAKGQLTTKDPMMGLSALMLYNNATILYEHLTKEADGQ